MALNEFEGTVMLVSHDRALLREVCDEFWLVTGGQVEPFDGDLDDYQKWLLDNSREQAKALREANAKPNAKNKESLKAPTNSASNNKQDRKAATQARLQRSEDLKPLRKELNTVDNRLGVLFAERDQLEAVLASGNTPPKDLAESGKKLKTLLDEITTLEGRWLELSTEIDTLSAST
jgi:ATP-binding cassette subfamily F protein 3